ncbi:TPA: hypothetical protein O5T91_002291 [Staphylococcus aureus]|nr:hypothetical protein [Staphylococcus aureus]HDH1032207.1 hypothetical protein [Staphylococcus aureus]
MTPTLTMPEADDPITLQEACEIAFRGNITVSSLRVEARRGNLEVFRVGRRDFTTLNAIRDMRKKCQGVHKDRASTLTPAVVSGLSETDRVSYALDALNQTTKALKSDSGNTSQANTGQRRARRR